MKIKQPFMWRIIIAFAVMTTLVSGALSLSIVIIIYEVEAHLISEDLHHELDSVLLNDIKQGNTPRLDSRTRFYATNLAEYRAPDIYAELPEGFSEVVDGDEAFYVYVLERNGHRYMLVQDQSEFEAREKVLHDIVLAGFLLTVALAWLLGWLMARKVMAPIRQLAEEVRRREFKVVAMPPLAPEYAKDEVGQLAEAFDNAFDQLHHALERERIFTADVSHELRTPLMIISSSCELLEEMSLSPQESRQVKRIGRAADEMSALVQTFLELARGNTTQVLALVSLAEIAKEQSDLWSPLMQAKGLNFKSVELEPDTGRYNPTLLRTVMANLLRNALHYTERGDIQLKLVSGGFYVEDSGDSIPAEQQEDIFQPFVRGSQARGEGLGLGLSLVRRICIHQGWVITMHTMKPHGNCFSVRLDGTN